MSLIIINCLFLLLLLLLLRPILFHEFNLSLKPQAIELESRENARLKTTTSSLCQTTDGNHEHSI